MSERGHQWWLLNIINQGIWYLKKPRVGKHFYLKIEANAYNFYFGNKSQETTLSYGAEQLTNNSGWSVYLHAVLCRCCVNMSKTTPSDSNESNANVSINAFMFWYEILALVYLNLKNNKQIVPTKQEKCSERTEVKLTRYASIIACASSS